MNPVIVTQISDITPVLSKEFFDIQATAEFRFTMKYVLDIIKIHSQLKLVSFVKS